MQNSTFNPPSIKEFDKAKVSSANKGVIGNIVPNGVANIDLDLTDDVLLTGIQIHVENSTFGDKFMLQVIDVDGVLPSGAILPPETILALFGDDIYIPSDNQTKLDEKSDYPAKIIAGLTLRIVYYSTGETASKIAVNYRLHKVLV